VTVPRIGRLPAALPSYNIYPCAEIIRSLRRLPANYERIKNAGQASFPGLCLLLRRATCRPQIRWSAAGRSQ